MNARTGRGEDGFSLLELVVAVGIVLVLSIAGFVGYGAITASARAAAVESAAEKTYKAAIAAEASEGSWGSIEKVRDDWNDSQEQTSVEITRDDDGQLCVSASFDGRDDVQPAWRGVSNSDCGEQSSGVVVPAPDEGGDDEQQDFHTVVTFMMSNQGGKAYAFTMTDTTTGQVLLARSGVARNIELWSFQGILHRSKPTIEIALEIDGEHTTQMLTAANIFWCEQTAPTRQSVSVDYYNGWELHDARSHYQCDNK